MTDVFLEAVPIFLLIFCRVTAFFVVTPIFNHRNVPAIFKIGLGFFISLLIVTVHGPSQAMIIDIQYFLLVIREVLIGLMMGFIVYLFFVTVQTAGGIIDMQIGFAMANIVDPVSGVSVPLLGNFKYMLLLVVFLMMNGHHFLLTGLMDSYLYIPIENQWFSRMGDGSLAQFLTNAVISSIVIGVQVALPIMVAMFITDVGLGFLAKTAPQFNVFVIGFPVKIMLGLLLIFLLMPGMAVIFEKIFTVMFNSLEQFFGVVQGPPA
ncbi:flagellar biosynthetic protein FliR [Paenibacillus camelliae]|uniref:flagellar biosynthetic protein FliR n=1 Tax=Paenibacillus camelliae TaxID=512410 RepID=UPI00203E58EA|nr:flagellar biosynthetic protein FliR [Paenibacillus camelliae]MCM3632023.1 flagellar type III secretion system protein FliR [Paenibacillus camelliae]